ncbi:MAG: hypothetical protein ACW98A_13085 [Candidatus Hodarchaeales archaeon]
MLESQVCSKPLGWVTTTVGAPISCLMTSPGSTVIENSENLVYEPSTVA